MFVNEMSVQKFSRADDEKIALKYCGLIMSDINIRYVQEVIYIASTL